jgi:glycosyltransferase involved in cell wall biosynthesis
MNIGLNLLFLLPGEVGGTETYALSLIQALSQVDLENRYYLFINNEAKNLVLPVSKNFIPVRCNFYARNRLIRFLWEQLALPVQAVYHRLDILHSPGYITPLILKCKSVVTIHDLNYLAIPEVFTFFTRIVQRVFVSLSVLRVNQIIAVSEFTKIELCNNFNVPQDKITVTLEAPKNRDVQPFNDEIHREKFLGQFGIGKPFILAFSSLAQHKNIPMLIDAFIRANASVDNRWTLVVVGHLPVNIRKSDQITGHHFMDTFKVAFTGYLPDDDITRLLSSADLFAFPSLYEGFGLPVLEAMQHGIPVACSNRGSLPEIAGCAAIYFDPTDLEAMAESMVSLMTNRELRQQFSALGKYNVSQFSWERCARETLAVYEKT